TASRHASARDSSSATSALQHRTTSAQPGPSGGHTLRPSTVRAALPRPWPPPSLLESLNAFGDSFTSRKSLVPTGLSPGAPPPAAPPDGGSGLAAGGAGGAGLATGGDDGSG